MARAYVAFLVKTDTCHNKTHAVMTYSGVLMATNVSTLKDVLRACVLSIFITYATYVLATKLKCIDHAADWLITQLAKTFS